MSGRPSLLGSMQMNPDEALIAGKAPIVLELEPGNYAWCSCGRSSNQPWCDGAHKECNLRPMRISIEEKKNYAMCTCKQTGNPPFCDGSHKNC